MRVAFVFVLLGCISRLAYANLPGDTIFVGTIGQFPIAMQIDVLDDTDLSATYCYQSKLLNISLSGTQHGRNLVLAASGFDDKVDQEVITETFRLHAVKNGSLAGEWRPRKGKPLPVRLHPLLLTDYKHPFAGLPVIDTLRKNDPLGYYEMSLLTVTHDSISHEGKYTLDWIGSKQASSLLFQIATGYPEAIRQKINRVLMNAFLDETMNELQTLSMPRGEFSSTVDHILLTDNVVSLNRFAEWDGGAHPDFGDAPITINARTGEQLQLEDVMRLIDMESGPELSSQWMAYRDSAAPALIVLLTQLYPEQMISDSTGCDYTTVEAWEFADWYLTEKGLYLAPAFPHVEGPCRDPEWSVIPYAVLEKYRNPKVRLQLP